MLFAVVSLTTSAVIGSMILGLISKGKEREGLKYMPVLVAVSIGLFFITRFVIKNVLGGLFSS